MSILDGLTPAEREQAEAAVARLRAEQPAAFGEQAPQPAEGLTITRPAAAALGYTPAAAPSSPRGQVDELLAQQEAREVEDFGAFWSSRGRTGKRLRNVVPGTDVVLPAELPLAFEVEARRLADDKTMAAVHHLFGLLYGSGTLAELIAGGLTGEQLSVLLVWGSANGNGVDMTLDQAVAEFERMKAAQGKAPGLPGSGGTSSGTGP